MMQPDYERAATAAAETLIKYEINAVPVEPLAILESIPGVRVVSYQMMSNDAAQDRDCIMSMFGEKNLDSFTTVKMNDGHPQYLVTYNKRLSSYLFHRALARELGHIILGHDGTLPEDVRNEEAKCFAHHLLVPRALIHLIKAAGMKLTTEVLGNLTGCNDYCLSCMRKIPAVHVNPELNAQVRDQFKDYFFNFFEFQRLAALKDGSALADLGTYMDGYEE
jgi:hypothetical protein